MKKINISIDKIRSMLQEVKYPGFNRDIVSFGMVKNISIEGITIDISLQINSDNKENLIQLRDRIEKTLHKNGLDEVKICTAYRCGDDTLADFPSDVSRLESCEAIYETLPGWSKPTQGVKRLEDLPPEARAYIARLEEVSNAPFAIISTGSDREETIVRKDSFLDS